MSKELTLTDPFDFILRIEQYDTKMEVLSKFIECLNEIVKTYKEDITDNSNMKYDLFKRIFVSKYSGCIPNFSALQIMIEYSKGKTILEVESGNGFWARLIEILGGIIIPTETNTHENLYHYGIKQYSAVEAVKNFESDVLFMSKLEQNTYAHDVLSEFKGDTFFFIGDGRSEFTTDNSFFNLLEKEWVLEKNITLLNWKDNHDSLSIYKRVNNCNEEYEEFNESNESNESNEYKESNESNEYNESNESNESKESNSEEFKKSKKFKKI